MHLYGKNSKLRAPSVRFEVNLAAKSHVEEVRPYPGGHRDNLFWLFRFLRPVTVFAASPAQAKKIRGGRGRLRITQGMMDRGRGVVQQRGLWRDA